MPMEETGGIFDNFLDYQNVDRMELFEENGNRINLPTERSADNDVVIETKAWGNEEIMHLLYPIVIRFHFLAKIQTTL